MLLIPSTEHSDFFLPFEIREFYCIGLSDVISGAGDCRISLY